MAPCSIVLHAGAGESYRGDSDSTEDICRFLQELAADSKERLRLGVSAVDVVVDVTAALEDCPYFNAGKGASLNIAGWHEVCHGLISTASRADRLSSWRQLSSMETPVSTGLLPVCSERGTQYDWHKPSSMIQARPSSLVQTLTCLPPRTDSRW